MRVCACVRARVIPPLKFGTNVQLLLFFIKKHRYLGHFRGCTFCCTELYPFKKVQLHEISFISIQTDSERGGSAWFHPLGTRLSVSEIFFKKPLDNS